jgi:hypothetical protein
MHLEVLVEDSSGKVLLDALLPMLLAPPHTWRLHAYKGIGRIPKGLKPVGSAQHRILLDQLPRLLNGFGRTPGIDAVVVVLDSDKRPCSAVLGELRGLLDGCPTPPNATLFRLAIEEIEAWYFGDREALLQAYPDAKQQVLDDYVQDSVCGTWERMADAVHPGGAAAVARDGWPLSGQLKHEWARAIGPRLNPARNVSPSFGKLCEGVRRLVGGVET